jgi:hypothetical protein
MGNFKRRSLSIALGVALCGTQTAFSLPLEGLFTVDPTVIGAGFQPPGYYFDPPGSAPPYYYLPPYKAGPYASGSIFVMNDSTGVLVDPLTGRVISPTAAWTQQISEGFRRKLAPGSDGGFIAGTFQNFVTTPDEVHSVGATGTNCFGTAITIGDASQAGTQYCATPATPAGVLAPFPFFTASTYTGTNPVSYVTGNAAGTPTFDYDPVTGEFTVDLSSWAVLWNGTVFDQGPGGTGTDGTNPVNYADAVDASFDPVTKRYSVSWGNLIIGGPFNGFNGYWHFEGTYEGDTVIPPPVPVPAAAWLFGSGLLGLAGLARRKTKSN